MQRRPSKRSECYECSCVLLFLTACCPEAQPCRALRRLCTGGLLDPHFKTSSADENLLQLVTASGLRWRSAWNNIRNIRASLTSTGFGHAMRRVSTSANIDEKPSIWRPRPKHSQDAEAQKFWRSQTGWRST
jgi:hypothetical protein